MKAKHSADVLKSYSRNSTKFQHVSCTPLKLYNRLSLLHTSIILPANSSWMKKLAFSAVPPVIMPVFMKSKMPARDIQQPKYSFWSIVFSNVHSSKWIKALYLHFCHRTHYYLSVAVRQSLKKAGLKKC